MTYTYVSNQGFAGGFDVGMTQAGFKLIHKVEMKGGFGLANCLANRDILGHDWTYQSGEPHEWIAPHADVVAGNPPCSGWSLMSNKDFRGANSPILACTWAFVEHVARINPTIAVFESVQQAFTKEDGLDTMRQLRAFLEERTHENWTLYHVRHNAYSVGGVAERKRYFWLASKIPFGIEIPRITSFPVLNDAIQDLMPLERTWDAQPYITPASAWAEHLRSSSGAVDGHWYVNDNPPVMRIRDLLSGTDWLPGEHIALVARRHYEQHGKLPDSFSNTEAKIVSRDFNMGYTSPTRWDGKKQARVITGGALQLVVHPTQDRMISHREAARILGFPDDWKIEPLKNNSGLQHTWGKGITTHCGKWIGEWIRKALDGEPGSYTGHSMGEREFDIDVTHAWKNKPQPKKQIRVNRGTIKSLDDVSSNGSNMYAPNFGSNSMTEPVETDNARRGRPRPQATIDRDNLVFDALTEPMTKAALAEKMSLPASEVYLSLYRLRKDGRVARGASGNGRDWSRVEATPDAAVDADAPADAAVPAEV